MKNMTRAYLNNFKRLNMPPAEWLLMDKHLQRLPQKARAEAVLRQSRGNVDIIGDVHASFDRLTELLSRLGWKWDGAHLRHPEPSRRVIFIGDIVDGGDANLECLRLCMSVVRDGVGVALMGNHDWMLLAWLKGVMQPAYNGAQDDVIAEFKDCDPVERLAFVEFLQGMCETVTFSHPVLGDVECVHASPEESVDMLPIWLKEDENARALCAILGAYELEPSFEGRLVDWRPGHSGDRWTIYGHYGMGFVPFGKTICVDMGYASGPGALSLFEDTDEMRALSWDGQRML